MIDLKILTRAFITGTVLQVVLILLCHVSPWIMQHAFMFAGMMISATAAYLYAMDSGRGYFPGSTAGAIVGGACGFIGLVLMVALGDNRQIVIPCGTAICVLCGAVGGIFGQMAANLRAIERENRKRREE
jgi:hypothetical protein